MTNDAAKKYAERFNNICDFIYNNLDEDLSIEKLSKVANFSKYHFHRQFSIYMGISVFKFIQLLRLKRASYQLVFNQDIKVIDIALDSGFDNHESFSRAFKKNFKQTPSQFRKKPEWKPWHEKYNLIKYKGNNIMQIKIIDFEETKVAVLEHRGDPRLLNESVQRFIEWRKESSLSPVSSSNSYGIVYDDPSYTEPGKFRFDICGSITSDVPANTHKIINKTLPSGRCAVLRHTGSHDLMNSKIYDFYGKWLPESKEELRDVPMFFHYINLLPEVPESELLTDIYLPLK
ncbi:MAG: AraC family transcriptional regulator [Psychromonas sp.]|jgi:AraC family transcriptional regulator|uniref:AraC family transcriptional regulator n=1 Tax=Psychromonas sp. TaxID=1884585 RepID=UPI0039E3E1CF